MSLSVTIINRAYLAVLLLASLVAISSGVVHFGNCLVSESVPEHSFAWARLASGFQGQRVGVMCKDASAVNSVDRARLIAISWACNPHPPIAIDFQNASNCPPVLISSAFLSALERARIQGSGYSEVASNEFAIAWTNAGVVPGDPPAKVSPLREAVGVLTVMLLMLALWVWWRMCIGGLPSRLAFCCAAVVFAMLSALTMTHTLIPPNGLGVYAGKAKLFLEAAGIPRGFFASPEYALYQPSYPPGQTLMALVAYGVSGACGDWLIQLLVPFALALLVLEQADCTRHPIAALVVAAFAVVPIAIKMAEGFYAEPMAALVLVMGMHRAWRRGDWSGWLMAGASGLFRHECVILVSCLWVMEMLSGGRARWWHIVAGVAFSLCWESFVCIVGARLYDFDFCAWPQGRHVLLAFAAAFSWKIVAAVVVLCFVGGRSCVHVAAASVLFMVISALLAAFNVSSNFEWFLENSMPRVAWLAIAPLVARVIFLMDCAEGSRFSGLSCTIFETSRKQQRKETKVRVEILACALIGATLLVGSSHADTANNSFASVSGDGVEADGESGFAIKNVKGPVAITVTERPGWKCANGSPFSYTHNEGDIDKINFKGRDDEEDVTVSISNVWVCVHEAVERNIHGISPGAECKDHMHKIAAYSAPGSKGAPLSYPPRIELEGVLGYHTNQVIALPCPNPQCDYGSKNPLSETVIEIDPRPVVAWATRPAGGVQEANGRIVYPKNGYTVVYTADFKCNCKACCFHKEVRLPIDVYEATSKADEYIGLDRTDEGYKKDHTMPASVAVEAVPPNVAYNWNVGPHCKFEGSSTSESVVCIVKRKAANVPGGKDFEYSDKYRQEHLSCGIDIWDNCDPSCKTATTTTNEFTIVKIDVVIDDVPESLEEAEGAFTYYVPDGDVPIWAEEWTNSLKDVSITCKPSDGEMATQEVKLKFPPRHLYVMKKDGTCEEAKDSYTVEELNKTKFKLHGHEKSAKYKDKEIVAFHKGSGAIDKAQFTVFGRPWLIPDYDRKDGIDDGDIAKAKEGKTIFRFWVNDDDDYSSRIMNLYDFEKPISFTHPGGINAHNRNVQKSGDNCSNNEVDGQNDLVDFTPFLIDLSEVFFSKEPDEISKKAKWELKSDCVRVVWTKLSAENAESFHTEKNRECGKNLNKSSYEADSARIKDWTSFSPAFTKHINNNKGVVLVEGCVAAGTNSKFQIRGMLDGKILTRGAVNLSISEVEDMFRWINLRSVTGDNGGKLTNTANPTNRPDDECDAKHFVFVHGYNVNKDSAVGWTSEIFKRLWQAGLKSKFVGVDWHGDESQLCFPIPIEGTVAPNYYVNVEHAFNTAASLKTELDKLDGPKVVMAHSLGNVLVSSAICDKGLACKYYLLNAAVAGEAYDKDLFFEPMVPKDWRELSDRTWAANWYKLRKFQEYNGDFRRELFWKGRFASLKNAISFFSITEDVLTNPTLEDEGGAWSQQELFKGSLIKGAISGRRDAGWSFDSKYLKEVLDVGDPWDTSGSDMPGSRPSTVCVPNQQVINRLAENDIIQQPVFGKFRPVFEKFGKEAERMHKLEPMKIADTKDPEELRAYFLGHSVPATSFATGCNMTRAKLFTKERDYKAYERDGWPRRKNRWYHSDIKNVAYYYVSKFYIDIVNEN